MYLSRQEMATMDPYDILKGIYAYYTKVMEDNRDAIKPVFSVQDIEKKQRGWYFICFLTVEDGVFIDGKMERVEEVYDMGVRLLTLLWGYENSVGYPCSDDPEIHQRSQAIWHRGGGAHE